MGATWSCPSSRATPHRCLLPLTAWQAADLLHARQRHAKQLQGCLALRVQAFAVLFNLDAVSAAQIFREIFDSDKVQYHKQSAYHLESAIARRSCYEGRAAVSYAQLTYQISARKTDTDA
eukprot:12497-Heterococcus_DN1.PRE.3